MARRFNGATHKIDFGTVGKSSSASGYAWIYPLSNNSSNRDQIIFTVADQSDQQPTHVYFCLNDWSAGSPNRVYLWTRTTGGAWIDYNGGSGSNYSLNQWQHVGFIVTPSSTKIYVNGVITANISHSNSLDTGGTPALRIGGMLDEASDAFDGRIAYVGFHSTALTDGDILEAYRKGFVFGKNAEVLSPIWDRSPEVDLSGNDRSGTVTGTTIADGPPVGYPFPQSSYFFFPPSISGGTYNETISLVSSLALMKSPSLIMSPSVTMGILASQSDGNNAVLSTSQSLAVSALLSWAGILTQSGNVNLDGQVSIASSGNVVLNPVTTFSVDVLSSWFDSLAGIIESLTLSVDAGMIPNTQAILQAIGNLDAVAAQVNAAYLTGSSTASLPVSVLTGMIDSLAGIVESIVLSVQGSIDSAQTGALIGHLSLTMQSALQAQTIATINGLISVGIQADIAQSAGLALAESMTLQIQSALISAGSVSSVEIGKILQVLSQSLKVPVITDSLNIPSAHNENLN